MLMPESTIRRMRQPEPRITEIVTDRLDVMAAAGPAADLVESFALLAPSPVICELLGVPYADGDEFQRDPPAEQQRGARDAAAHCPAAAITVRDDRDYGPESRRRK
jgi:cytochrome P450